LFMSPYYGAVCLAEWAGAASPYELRSFPD
jgi:hypothetical protein